MFGDLSAAISPSVVPKSTFDFPALVARGCDPVDPAGRLVAEGVAADARVVPVGDEDRAVGRRAGIDRPEPRVVAGKKHLVLGPERGPLAGQRKKLTCRVPASTSRTAPWYSAGSSSPS